MNSIERELGVHGEQLKTLASEVKGLRSDVTEIKLFVARIKGAGTVLFAVGSVLGSLVATVVHWALGKGAQ